MEEKILEFLSGLGQIAEYVVLGLGTLVVLATGWIKLTPSKKDDKKLEEWRNKPIIGGFLKALEKFSVFERKKKE